LTDTSHLVGLFDKTESQNFNVLYDPSGPNLAQAENPVHVISRKVLNL